MEPIEGPGGRILFKETINDYRVLHFKFGRGHNNWNQLHDIIDDWGSLNKGVMKIKRSGAGIDTLYNLTKTDRVEEIPEDKLKEKSSLIPISDYVFGRYGGQITIYQTESKYVVESNDGMFS